MSKVYCYSRNVEEFGQNGRKVVFGEGEKEEIANGFEGVQEEGKQVDDHHCCLVFGHNNPIHVLENECYREFALIIM